MKNYMDFSDQVTFVSSQIIGRDFSRNKKEKVTYVTVTFNNKQYTIPDTLKSEFDSGDKSKKQSIIDKNGRLVENKKNDDPKNPNPITRLNEANKMLKEANKSGDEDAIRLAQEHRESVYNAAGSYVENAQLKYDVENFELDKKKAKLERQKAIREDGGRVRHGIINLINTVQGSKEGSSLPEFHNKDWEEELSYTPEKGGLVPEGAYEKDGKWYRKHKKDTITGYLANNPKFAKAAGEVVKSSARTAADTAMNATGWEGYSGKTKYLRDRADASKKVANKLAEETGVRVRRADSMADKALRKAEEAESEEKFGHVKKVTRTAGAGVDLLKTTVSSKARDKLIQREGVKGLEQRQAILMHFLGDRSKKTKIAVGDKKNLGLIGRIKANAYQSEINKRRNQYNQSLNAMHYPNGYTQYRYPVYGFSEGQSSALNDILSKDFSDEVSELEGLNLSWQPEEYAKLNAILEADFETLDAQVAEAQPDMPEKKVKGEEKVDEQQIEDSQSGEIDVSDTIDYDNLDSETMTALVDTSYYEVPKEEKEYQEMIAKGFAEKDNGYNSFLESMSDFADKSSF